MPTVPPHRLRRRPPSFRPEPLCARHDGWTPARQCRFLAQLYVNGSVAAAAVGMTRMSAHRLRRHAGAEHFAWAWDRVLEVPGTGRAAAPRPDGRKVTQGELLRLVEEGFVQPVLFRGSMAGIRRKPEISELLWLLRRCDRRLGAGGGEGA